MTLQQLNYVITIAESGLLNRDVEILYVAQPSLSSSIKELERDGWALLFLTEAPGAKEEVRRFDPHYSLAVKAFVELVKAFDISFYEFVIREAKTRDVIIDVASMKSAIGILHLSDFNRAAMLNLIIGQNGCIRCSGIICQKRRIALPFPLREPGILMAV